MTLAPRFDVSFRSFGGIPGNLGGDRATGADFTFVEGKTVFVPPFGLPLGFFVVLP